MAGEGVGEQSDAATGALRRGLTDANIVGLYLYGSAVVGGLRPDSDLDLFVVTDRRLTAREKARIIQGLLPISGRETRPSTWRPIEMTIVAQPEVRPWRYPPRMELRYGEWLRDVFLSGASEPEPAESPDLGVLITMVRQSSRPLIGTTTIEVLDAVPRADLVGRRSAASAGRAAHRRHHGGGLVGAGELPALATFGVARGVGVVAGQEGCIAFGEAPLDVDPVDIPLVGLADGAAVERAQAPEPRQGASRLASLS